MKSVIESGDAGYALYENVVIQAQSRSGYWVSGGQVNPGTSTSQLTVAVEPGEANINGQSVSWASDEVVLAPGGQSPSSGDTNDPRVDVIFVAQNGTLDAKQGVPAPYAPDTKLDNNGNEVPYQPAPMEHWEPAPAETVGGVVLALVLVEANDTVSADIATTAIKNFKVGATSGGSAFIRGDGVPTGPIHIAVDNDPVTIEDESNPNSGPFFEYDPTNDAVVLGTDDATPTLGESLATNGNNIEFDSSQSPFRLVDNNPDTSVPADGLRITSATVSTKRPLNMSGNRIANSGQIQFGAGTSVALDLIPETDGVRTIWQHNDGGNGDVWTVESAPGAQVGDPAVYSINNDTSGAQPFAVHQSGTIKLGPTTVEANGNIVFEPGRPAKLQNINALEFDGGGSLFTRDSDGSLMFTDNEGTTTQIVNSP